MKKFKIILSIVLIVAVVVVAAGALIFPRMMGNIMLHPKRMPLVKNPADYGLQYEDVSIKTEDGVTLAGWLMKGTGNDVVVMGHPGTFSRYGYSLTTESVKSGYARDVEFVPATKHLVNAGYSVLMYDQRNHGASGASPNDGPHNPVAAYRDVVAVVKYVSEHPDLANKDIGLCAFCQSSFVSMVAMSKDPEFLKKAGVKAFVAVQPISVEIFYGKFGFPKWVINGMKRFYKGKGLDMKDQDPTLYAPNVFVPVLFVQNINDPWSDIEHSRAIYNAFSTEKEAIWIDEEEHHRFHTYNWFNDHPEKLIDFMNRYLVEPDLAEADSTVVAEEIKS